MLTDSIMSKTQPTERIKKNFNVTIGLPIRRDSHACNAQDNKNSAPPVRPNISSDKRTSINCKNSMVLYPKLKAL
jgi:hypothetical protein